MWGDRYFWFMLNEQLTDKIIAAAIRVHNALGPGLLESAYRDLLCFELSSDGCTIEKEKVMPVVYKGTSLTHGYRMDILVDNRVVVELKTVPELNRVHSQQLLTYLKLGNFTTGLLINFHAVRIKEGLKRITNSPAKAL
jgi:GxxExxY protein